MRSIVIFPIYLPSSLLNVQRNQLINEVDSKIIEIIEAKLSGEDLDNGKFLQRAHKTY